MSHYSSITRACSLMSTDAYAFYKPLSRQCTDVIKENSWKSAAIV
jgi:hypothetical protein